MKTPLLFVALLSAARNFLAALSPQHHPNCHPEPAPFAGEGPAFRSTASLLFILTLACAAPALAQRSLESPLPPTGNVTLSLDEYNRLLALANRPGKQSELPPLPYILKRADLKFRVSNDDVLGSVQLEGETLGATAAKVPLTTGLTVLDARQGSRPLPLLLDNGTHVAVLPGESQFSVNLDAGVPLAIETGRASFLLPVPSAGSVRLFLTVPGERANVQLNHGIITHRASVKGNTEIEATLVPGQAATIWWATREVVAPVTPREVRFLSDVKTLVSVSESDLQIAVLADLTVVQGEADQFSVAIPEGFEVTSVNGASLESSEIQNGVLLLHVAGRGHSAHEFLVSMERPLADAKATAPILAFNDAQRETGEVLVEGQGTLELAAHESGGLKRLDIKEINPYLRALSRYSLEAAFRYHRQPDESPTLALDWTRFPDASVLAAVAEHAVVTTLVTSEGKSLTEVKLTVKNQAQPFLKVDLPAGVNILTAEVAGEKVKPVQGADGSRVPLLRTGFRPAGAYTVSFVFLHAGSPFAKKGDAGLSLPKMDIPISILEWEVFLPEQYKVKDFGGDALSASFWPSALDSYNRIPTFSTGEGSGIGAGVGGGSFRAGAGAGISAGAGSLNLPMNGRNFASFAMLSPGFALAPNQLGGIVTDPSGAVIASAVIEVKNLSTNATWSASTSSDGRWLLPNVPSGTYQITANAQGFQTMRNSFTYDSSNPRSYQIGLNLGDTNQAVQVTAGAPTADTSITQLPFGKHKKAAPPTPPPASANVYNLQQRVAGVLPVAVDIPRAGASYRFLRPLVLNEETKLSFAYKSK
ncbi:MAG TPA: carboxypeptidase-like regulatory domain-containing protein [Candidatus Acidoferrum sp.]|nr:carboxypeptidase-like regulatory domain-containing protein [Candidatus Acidoferrum sp.]